jgi:hypothetical protein
MPHRKALFLIFLIVSVGSLALGYALGGQLIMALAALIPLLGWLFARQYPTACLVVSICLPGLGLLVGASPFLMILSCTASLACWDLRLLDAALQSSSLTKEAGLFENQHIQTLLLALGGGFLLASAGTISSFQIPFGIMVLLVILAVLGLERVSRALKNQNK